MKKNVITFFSFLGSAFSQNPEETTIRKLEGAQSEAIIKKDTTALYKIFSPDFVVNAPTNKITTLQQLKHLIQSGEFDMEVFERVTERVTFNNNIAIAMDNEILHPSGKMPNAGKTVKRRYTNIWMKTNGTWQLVARQATIISVD